MTSHSHEFKNVLMEFTVLDSALNDVYLPYAK